MNNALLLVLAVSVIAAGLVASLWENPPDGRFSRQRRAGVFHRLLAKLWWSFALLLNDALGLWTQPLFRLHCIDLVPMWLVNLPCYFIPDGWLRAAARAHMMRWEAKQQADEEGRKP